MFCCAAGVLDQALGQLGAFAIRDHPADDVAAEDIQDDVEMIDGPLHRAAQLGDVPTPQLIGCGGQQLRLLIGRMSELIAALAAFAMRFQQTVHGANRAMKPAFIEQGRVDLRGRAILKTLLMKTGQHGGLFAFRKRPRRMPLRVFRRWRQQEKDRDVCDAGTRWRAEPPAPGRLASLPPRDGVDPRRP